MLDLTAVSKVATGMLIPATVVNKIEEIIVRTFKKFFWLAILVSLIVPVTSFADNGHRGRHFGRNYGHGRVQRQVFRNSFIARRPGFMSYQPPRPIFSAPRLVWRPGYRNSWGGGNYYRDASYPRRFSFNFGYPSSPTYYAPTMYQPPVVYPAPVYVQLAPVVLERPVVVQPSLVMVERPVVTEPIAGSTDKPVATSQPASGERTERAVSKWQSVTHKGRTYFYLPAGHRLHQKGSDAGLLDKIWGVTNDGRRIEIEYHANGTVDDVDID